MSASICEDCLRITPADLKISSKPLQLKNSYGALEASAPSCPACALILTTLESCKLFKAKTRLEGKPIAICNSNKKSASGDTTGDNLIHLARIKFDWQDNQDYLESTALNVCNDPNHDNPVILGSEIPIQVDPDLSFIQERLDTCEREHRDFCRRFIAGAAIPTPFARLYNITEHKLETFEDITKQNPGAAVEYTAISYIWGEKVLGYTQKIKDISTVQGNIEARLAGDFDVETLPGCPKAYVRAVEITRTLGMKYIWIDSLCIVQGSEPDRIRHFETLDAGVGQIYENARVTLCSIGHNVEFDLLANRTRPEGYKTVPIPGAGIMLTTACIRLIGSIKAPGVPFEDTDRKTGIVVSRRELSWDAKGWPFQERLLSPRLAYFTPSQMFFECRKVFDESGDSMEAANYRRLLRSDETDTTKEIHSEWAHIVRDSSRRELGYWSDRINAVRAIAMQMEQRAKHFDMAPKLTFYSGLFLEYIYIDLLWQAFGAEKQLEVITPAQWKDGKQPQPPSWSWAYFRGQIDWDGHLNQGGVVTEISEVSIDVDTTTKLQSLIIQDAALSTVFIGENLLVESFATMPTWTSPASPGDSLKKISAKGRLYSSSHYLPNMFVLLDEGTKDALGWCAVDQIDSVNGDGLYCLLVSENSYKVDVDGVAQDCKSWNVLLLSKDTAGVYERRGMGEVFKKRWNEKAKQTITIR